MQRHNPNGLILHVARTYVVVATGFKVPSVNDKTGPMVQVWILRRDRAPTQAVKDGTDRAICGSCALRGIKGIKRACYVDVAKAPTAVWQAYRRGRYARWNGDPSVFEGFAVRFGAYGDPAKIPLPIIEAIAARAEQWTGYTHQWRECAPGYARFVMASTDTMADRADAIAAGWRYFGLGEPTEGESIACPSSTGVQCIDCGLCKGTSMNARSITIPAHGVGALNAPAMN